MKGQDELKNPVVGCRNIRLDIRAVLGDGRQVYTSNNCNNSGTPLIISIYAPEMNETILNFEILAKHITAPKNNAKKTETTENANVKPKPLKNQPA